MKKRKIMMSVMSAALVGVVAIGGTLAYMSDKSNQVTNTFNLGSGYVEEGDHIGLWLDEKDIANPGSRTEIGNEYKEMLPGSLVEKDPTFHLTTGSTDSYVFAQVTGVDAMIADGYYFTVAQPEKLTDPAESAFSDKWEKVADNGDDTDAGFDGLYVYKTVVKGGELGQDGEVVTAADSMEAMFNWVKLGSDLENEEFANVNPSSVDIRGVAIQSANLTREEAQAEVADFFATMPW